MNHSFRNRSSCPQVSCEKSVLKNSIHTCREVLCIKVAHCMSRTSLKRIGSITDAFLQVLQIISERLMWGSFWTVTFRRKYYSVLQPYQINDISNIVFSKVLRKWQRHLTFSIVIYHHFQPFKAWCPLKGHKYLNKPAAFNCGFV